MIASENIDALDLLLKRNFPQYAKPNIEVFAVSNGSVGASMYQGRIRLFDQVLVTSGVFPTEFEAREAILKTAVDCINEFVQLCNQEMPEDIAGPIGQVKEIMTTFITDQELPVEFPEISKFINTPNSADNLAIVRPSLVDAKPQIREENPIQFLQQYAFKSGLSEPLYEFFERQMKHGCKLTLNGSMVTTNAVYVQKAEARLAAAKILCEQLFGNLTMIRFAGPKNGPIPIVSSTVESRGEEPKSPPIAADDAKQPAQTSCISQLNLLCQKLGISMPTFGFQESSALRGVFICEVNDYLGLSFASKPYNKKSLAKEEVAKFMFEKIQVLAANNSGKLKGRLSLLTTAVAQTSQIEKQAPIREGRIISTESQSIIGTTQHMSAVVTENATQHQTPFSQNSINSAPASVPTPNIMWSPYMQMCGFGQPPNPYMFNASNVMMAMPVPPNLPQPAPLNIPGPVSAGPSPVLPLGSMLLMPPGAPHSQPLPQQQLQSATQFQSGMTPMAISGISGHMTHPITGHMPFMPNPYFYQNPALFHTGYMQQHGQPPQQPSILNPNMGFGAVHQLQQPAQTDNVAELSSAQHPRASGNK